MDISCQHYDAITKHLYKKEYSKAFCLLNFQGDPQEFLHLMQTDGGNSPEDVLEFTTAIARHYIGYYNRGRK